MSSNPLTVEPMRSSSSLIYYGFSANDRLAFSIKAISPKATPLMKTAVGLDLFIVQTSTHRSLRRTNARILSDTENFRKRRIFRCNRVQGNNEEIHRNTIYTKTFRLYVLLTQRDCSGFKNFKTCTLIRYLNLKGSRIDLE